MAQGNNAEYYNALNAICGAFRLSDEWRDTFQEIANITSSISSINFKTLSERYSQIVQDLNPTIMRMGETISNAAMLPENMSPNKLSQTLATAISMAANSIRTPEIDNLLMSYRESYWVDGIREFANSIFPKFASTHPVGEKIWEAIRDCDNYMGFDREYYFHARLMEENGHLFVESDMRKAPNEVVGYGRFNHLKESHYYFTDTEIGAKTEIHKHNKHTGKESRIQVARIRPRPSIPIKMIDLSGRNTSKNAFLEMIRYECDGDTRYKPTQYLLPEYVTSCCKNAGIDGIKYYGNKEYRNYVCWEDYYFDIDKLFCNISDYEYHDA